MDRELVNCEAPVPDRHGPFLHDIFQAHKEQFKRRFVAGEAVSGFGDFSQRIIQRFYGVCCIDRRQNILRVGKERDDMLPVAAPGFGDHGIVAVPAILEVLKRILSLFDSRCTADVLEIGGDLFALFP